MRDKKVGCFFRLFGVFVLLGVGVFFVFRALARFFFFGVGIGKTGNPRSGCVCACVRGAGARWRFVLCARRRKKYKNARHKRTTPANTALRSRAARARHMSHRAAQEARGLAGARRECSVGVSDPELRQHTETPALTKVAAVIADAAVPTAAAVTTATVSQPSRLAPRENRAERRGSARTRRSRRQRSPYKHAMLRARAGSRLVAVVGCGPPEHGVRSRDG